MARVGIFGASQLGGYLCKAATQLGVASMVLASSSEDVAVPVTDDVLLLSVRPRPAANAD